MAGELLASLGFTPNEIANLGGDAAVAAIEAQISSNIDESRTPALSTNTVDQSSIRPVSSSNNLIVNQPSEFVPQVQIQELLGSNNDTNNNTNINTKTNVRERPDPKFKIGDWVEGTDENPGQINSVQWMEQEGLYRYRIAHAFGEDSWAEGQLGSIPAQDISQAPQWGRSGSYIDPIDLLSGGGGFITQSQPGVPLGETVSITSDPAKDEPLGPLEQFVQNTNLGSGGTGMAEGDIRGEGPFARYMRRRGFGTEGGMDMGTRAGRFVGDRFADLQDLFNLSQDIRAGGNVPTGAQDLQTFLDNIPDRAQRNVVGANILQNLFNMPADLASTSGFDFTRSFDAGGGLIEGTQALRRLQDLVQMGGAERFGSRGASFLAGRLPQIRNRFEVENPGGSFVNYFKNRYGF